MKKLVYIATFVIISLFAKLEVAQAQDKIPVTARDYNNQEVEMADVMRDNGKIFVVVGVVAIIMGGMFYYLIAIDRKVSKIEKIANEQ
ncbi:CcmD family protein [Algivirga pacifica]|uniref:CcmD family protein n=1 Tax=Algivirga pacifica TaxID=1162670 RepID=A0ABP9DJ24_9BACT